MPRRSTLSSLPLIRRLVSTYLRPRMGMLGLAIICMVISAAMTGLFARLIQPVIDDVMVRAGGDDSARAMILPMGLAILACFVIRGLASYGQSLQMARIGQMIIADIQNDLFRHLVRLDLQFFHDHPSSQLTSRMTSDVNVMRSAVTDALAGAIASFLTLCVLVGVMIYQDPHLAIIALGVLPVASLFVLHLGKKLRRISKSIQDQTAVLVERLNEIFQGIRQVHAYGREEYEQTRAGQAIDTVRKLNVKSVQVGEMVTPLNEGLIGIAIFIIVVYGGYRIADGVTTAGALLSFIAAFSLAYEPMKKMGKMMNALLMGLGAAERVFALMDQRPVMISPINPVPLRFQSAPAITFDHVSFSYPSAPDKRALDDMSVVFDAGKKTALVGLSGGGKSTIFNLILRFYDPIQGRVMLGDVDIRDADLADIRAHIALVSQDIHIFNASVRDNIAYGRAGVSHIDIMGAAMQAAAHDFIMAMPDGYDTVLGENGVRLSGGQRQRLAIARALLRDAPILLLDEATSALDNDSERAIQESLAILGQGRTTIMIAHRLSTVQHADKIVVIDGGKVAEAGIHDDLLSRGGIYTRLHGTLSA